MSTAKVKVLKFSSKNEIELSQENFNEDYDVIQCDKNKFTLSDFKEQVGHDDSLPYTAILCYNGKKVCSCLNDGWGGETELRPLDAASRVLMNNVILKLGLNYKFSYMSTQLTLTLDLIADLLAQGAYIKSQKTIKGRCYMHNANN